MREYVLTLLVAAAVTYILTPLVRRVAVRGKAMNAARDRDVHVVPTPKWGGLAMYFGLVAGLVAAGHMYPLSSVFTGTGTLSTETGLLLAGGLIVAIGMVDDRYSISPIAKLAGQVAAAAILVASGCELGWLPLPGGGTYSPTPNQAMVLTILVVVATMNAVNFIDGLDGLAAGIVTIGAVSFFLYYYWLTHVLRLSAEAQPALVSAVLAGICLGFLPHNFFPARIFMGDTGSLLLGLLLAYAPISSTTLLDPLTLASKQAYRLGTLNRFPGILPLLLPAAILVIPYADMLMAVFRRTRAGMSPFAPDRKHLHHRLLDIGHSHRSSVLIMYLWATMFSGAVVWLSIEKRPSWVFAAITVGALVSLLLMSMPRLRWWRHTSRRIPVVAAGATPAGAVPVSAAPVSVSAAPVPATAGSSVTGPAPLEPAPAAPPAVAVPGTTTPPVAAPPLAVPPPVTGAAAAGRASAEPDTIVPVGPDSGPAAPVRSETQPSVSARPSHGPSSDAQPSNAPPWEPAPEPTGSVPLSADPLMADPLTAERWPPGPQPSWPASPTPADPAPAPPVNGRARAVRSVVGTLPPVLPEPPRPAPSAPTLAAEQERLAASDPRRDRRPGPADEDGYDPAAEDTLIQDAIPPVPAEGGGAPRRHGPASGMSR